MPQVSKFIAAAAATALLGIVGALLAAFGLVEAALVLVNLALVMAVATVVLADRRRAGEARRSADRLAAIDSRAGRTEKKVDMMQRRVIASLEAARFDAAERDRRAAEKAS